MSTYDHPKTDDQTECANCVLEEILRGYVHSFSTWSEFLPMVEFAINNSVHASTTHTPLYVNGLRHPRIPVIIQSDSGLRGEGLARSKTGLDLAHHVSPHTSIRLMPMSTKSILSVAMTLQIYLTVMTILTDSASLMTIPATSLTPSLTKRRAS